MIPSAFASAVRAMAHPSLFDSTITGTPASADEHEVAQVLAEERDARRRRTRARLKRFEALLAAWTANDVDRAAVAKRFGYRDARSAGRCLYRYRRRAARNTSIRQEASR